MKAKTQLRAECVRLRTEERLSLREIKDRTGASKGSLSLWLRDYPLTSEERAQKAAKGVATRSRRRLVARKRPEKGGLQDLIRGKLSRHQKGKVAEMAVFLRLMLQGFAVFNSVFDGERADCVVEDLKTRGLWKIQVKAVQWPGAGKYGGPSWPYGEEKEPVNQRPTGNTRTGTSTFWWATTSIPTRPTSGLGKRPKKRRRRSPS